MPTNIVIPDLAAALDGNGDDIQINVLHNDLFLMDVLVYFHTSVLPPVVKNVQFFSSSALQMHRRHKYKNAFAHHKHTQAHTCALTRIGVDICTSPFLFLFWGFFRFGFHQIPFVPLTAASDT